jgi:hypothetical protein
MVDYSQFVFHERDHSYGYAEEVSVASGSDYCPRIEHRQLYHHYQIKPVAESMLEACQDMPLNLSLNSPQFPLWDSMPVIHESAASAAAATSPAYSDEADIDQAGEGGGGECPELGSLFIVSDLGAHIAQEEIVESEVLDEDETEQEEEEEESSTDEEDEGVQQLFNHEISRNSRLRSKVNDLTKASKVCYFAHKRLLIRFFF